MAASANRCALSRSRGTHRVRLRRRLRHRRGIRARVRGPGRERCVHRHRRGAVAGARGRARRRRLRYWRCDVRDIGALKSAIAEAARGVRPDPRARQQCRARRPAPVRRRHPRILGRQPGGEPAAPVLRGAGGRAADAGAGGGSIINLGSVSWMRGRPEIAELHDGESGDQRAHAHACAGARPAQHPRQLHRPRRDRHRAAARAVALAGERAAVPGAAMPQVPVVGGRRRAHRAVPGIRRGARHHRAESHRRRGSRADERRSPEVHSHCTDRDRGRRRPPSLRYGSLSMYFSRPDFVAGARDMAPSLIGLVPFGLVCGVGAQAAGASPLRSAGDVGADVLRRGADSRRAADRRRRSDRGDDPHVLRRRPALPHVQRGDGAALEAAAVALAACASRSFSPTRRSPRASGVSANPGDTRNGASYLARHGRAAVDDVAGLLLRRLLGRQRDSRQRGRSISSSRSAFSRCSCRRSKTARRASPRWRRESRSWRSTRCRCGCR